MGLSDFLNDSNVGYLLGAYLGGGIKQRMDNKSLKDAISATMQPQVDADNAVTQNLKNQIGNNLMFDYGSNNNGQQNNLTNQVGQGILGNISGDSALEKYYKERLNTQNMTSGVSLLSPDNNQKIKELANQYNGVGLNTDWLGQKKNMVTTSKGISREQNKQVSDLAKSLLQKDSTRDIGLVYDLLDKGYNMNTIRQVMDMDSQRRQYEDMQNQKSLEAQRQAQINNLVQKISYHRIIGDIGAANALQMELYPLLNANADAYTNYMKGAMPNVDLKSTNLGGETVITSFDKTGQLSTNNAIMPNSTSPDAVFNGEVSMHNNSNNNATSERNNIRSNSTSRQNTIDKITSDEGLYKEGYKGNKNKTDIPKYASELDEGFAKALQSIDNGDTESGKYLDDFNVLVGKYNTSMDDEDKAHAQELLYGLNALREYKFGNKEMAATYANALSPEVKQALGINF